MVDRETDKGLGKSKRWRVLASLGHAARDVTRAWHASPSTCHVGGLFLAADAGDACRAVLLKKLV